MSIKFFLTSLKGRKNGNDYGLKIQTEDNQTIWVGTGRLIFKNGNEDKITILCELRTDLVPDRCIREFARRDGGNGMSIKFFLTSLKGRKNGNDYGLKIQTEDNQTIWVGTGRLIFKNGKKMI